MNSEDRYVVILRQILDASSESPDHDIMSPAHFRAEAFLKVKGLYKE